MANKRITDLTEANALADTDFLAIDNASSTTRKVSYQNLGTAVLNSTAMTGALNNKQDKLTFDSTPTNLSTNPVYSGGVYTELSGKKNKQTAVSDPTAYGNALAFIDSISQNENGEISVTKKNVTTDSTPTENSTNPVQSGGVKSALDDKVDKVEGKQLSTEDYTTAEQNKLAGIESGATRVIVDSELDELSGDAVENAVVTEAINTLNADLASKADDSVVVKSVNTKTPTSGAVEITAEDIPADGIGDKSVSGNPITIEDGMASVAKELSVTLEPIQDLHGYESPWIGTDTDKAPYLFRAVSESSVQDKGTHELDKIVGGTVAFNQHCASVPTNTRSGITYTNNGDGSYTVNGTASALSYNIVGDGNVPINHVTYMCGCPQGGSNGTYSMHDGNSLFFDTGNGALFKKTTSTGVNCVIVIGNGYTAQNLKFVPQLFDLTQMFGSTIADYIYSLEQSTAGAGVAWFRRLFGKPYYPYNAGSLISVKTSAHVMVGKNQFDKTDTSQRINNASFSNGAIVEASGRIVAYIKCEPLTTYTVSRKAVQTNERFQVAETAELPAVGVSVSNVIAATTSQTVGNLMSLTITTSANAEYLAIWAYWGETAGALDTLQLELGSTATAYEPYVEHSYPLDSDLELRGIPKLVNNALVYDGDVYEASGNVQRRYGVVDLGTLDWSKSGSNMLSSNGLANAPAKAINTSVVPNARCSKYEPEKWALVDTGNDKKFCCIGNQILIQDSAYTDAASFKTAMSGVMLVYELATPTTETADPYTSMQVIDTSGTEEYVDTRTVAIPVGHESSYANVCPIEGRTETAVTRSDGAETDPDTDTASVTFGQTVYGGQVDFVSGKCRVTKVIVDLGTLNWYYTASGTPKFYHPDALTNRKLEGLICSAYTYRGGAGTSSSGLVDKSIYYDWNSAGHVIVVDSAYSNPSNFKAGVTGVQLCYELATPIELTLTPAQLSLLEGTNILTADGQINLTYLGSMASNVQDEIDEFESGLNNVIGSIAFIENSTAKTSHAVGEYIILNGIFCKVIAAVSSGETLSFGTNIQATTIGAELRAIWAEINS